jgi:hypothetical protein
MGGAYCHFRRQPVSEDKDDPLQKSLLDGDELEMGSLGPNVPHTSQPDIPHTSQPDIPHTSPPLDMDPNALNPVGSPKFDPDEGFPTNDSARTLCAKQWTAHRDLNTSFAGDGAAQHTTKAQYADLQAATSSFSDSHKIGDGGSCVVYKAKLYGVRPCAIKLLSRNASAFEEKQFTAEINVLTNVKHENICQLYACSTNGPSRCLVLELMGTSLEDRVRSDPSLGWEQRTYILVCVCRGLVHLHSQSPPMIHRDVKSQNGKTPHLYLANCI